MKLSVGKRLATFGLASTGANVAEEEAEEEAAVEFGSESGASFALKLAFE